MGFLWHVISEAIFTTLINKCDKILPSTCFCHLQSVLKSGRRCVPAVILSPGVFGLDEKLGLKIQYCHVQGWFARPGCRLLMMFPAMHLLSVNSKNELTLSVSAFLKGNDKTFVTGWMFRFVYSKVNRKVTSSFQKRIFIKQCYIKTNIINQICMETYSKRALHTYPNNCTVNCEIYARQKISSVQLTKSDFICLIAKSANTNWVYRRISTATAFLILWIYDCDCINPTLSEK